MLDLGVGQALEKPVRETVVRGGESLRIRRRRRHRGRRHPHPRDARRARRFLAGADVERSFRAARRPSAARRCPTSVQWAEKGAKLSGVEVVRGFNVTMAIRAAAAKLFCDLDYLISPVSPVVKFNAELASPLTIPTNRSSTSATPCRGTWRRIRPSRSMAVMTRRDSRSACRSSAAASTISACSRWPRRSKACAVRRSRGRVPPKK